MSHLEFRRLTPETGDDLLSYLGGDAFTDNPAWSTCFCFFYHFAGDGAAWRARSGDENRRDKHARIAAGRAHGVLAYSAADVVGWVNAGPLSELEALERHLGPPEPGRGAIVCYVVHPRHRGLGIGGRLLAEACAMLHDLGLDSVDAWPLKEVPADDQLPRSALIYHGTRSMYERAGFEVVESQPDSPFLRMRKALR